MTTDRDKKWLLLARACTGLAAALLLASAMSGFGTRLQWWGFRTGLTVLKWTVLGELVLSLVSLIGLITTAAARSVRARGLLVTALAISLASAILPVRMWLVVRSVPMIHDITTDTDNPPQFDAALKLRKGALNSAAYDGQKTAEEQHKAYPDIAPLLLDLPPAEVFQRSVSAARRLGWMIINRDETKGIIEATDTTFWFGFTDDIVIRISPRGKGSRIDLRSLSRVGKSDVGKNAGRIREFLKAVKTG